VSSPARGLVVVPSYNEAPNLPGVIERLTRLLPTSALLFVDDGSTDDSQAVLERAGVRYVRHPINLGYEEALRTGMREALAGGHPWIAFFDADGQHQAEDLVRIIAVHESDGADLVQGSRHLNGRASAPPLRALGMWIFAHLTTLFAGVRITDPTCGLKLIGRRFIPIALALPTEDMHAELIVGLARCGARVREVAITVRPRTAGTSMYHFVKILTYPPKTVICLVGELLFCRQLRRTLEAAPPTQTEPRPVEKTAGVLS
jgi:glycosyltransferase involved in cell wall biosynthesis